MPELAAIVGMVLEAMIFWRIYACLFGSLFASAAAWVVVPEIRSEPVFTVGAIVGLVAGACWQLAGRRKRKSESNGGRTSEPSRCQR